MARAFGTPPHDACKFRPMPEVGTSLVGSPPSEMRSIPRVIWRVVLVVVLLLAIAAVLFVYTLRTTPVLRDRVVTALNERFESQVQLGSLEVGAFPRPELRGTKLELRQNGRTDVPPLISVRDFSGSANLLELLQTPLHIRSITLRGLTIQIPPGGVRLAGGSTERSPALAESRGTRRRPSLAIDRIEADAAWLELASKNPLKPPRVFDIHQMVMTGFRPDGPAQFTAKLTNPIPEGEIETTGSFGPWLAGSPGDTAIEGKYSLREAQLDDIKGLDGTLSSTGSYSGTLERLSVTGETTSPNFTLDVANQPVPLNTTFDAVVDGTNGDTYLEAVHATLINTLIDATGQIVRARDIKGRHIALDVAISKGRLEDLLRLAMKPGASPMVGQIALKTKLLIPAGPADVIERMQLDGNFELSQARFTNFDVQTRINELSKRARGAATEERVKGVVSNLAGRFVLRNTLLTFHNLSFSVPGARVELAGSYGLRNETMNFTGELLLDASLAQTTTGWKSLAARVVQPFFRREGGGSKLPIKVTGTRDKPSFGLDVRRAFLPG